MGNADIVSSARVSVGEETLTLPSTGYPSLHQYWGKASREFDARPGGSSRHPLIAHCLDVGAVANVLLRYKRRMTAHWSNQCGITEDEFSRLVVFAAIVHDCGKLGVRFQAMRPDLMPRDLRVRRGKGERHDALGIAIWNLHVRERALDDVRVFSGVRAENRDDYENLLDSVVTAAICHHGKPVFCNRYSWERETYRGDPVGLRAFELFEIAARCSGLPINAPEHPEFLLKSWELASWWISGLVVLADWIGSNTNTVQLTILTVMSGRQGR